MIVTKIIWFTILIQICSDENSLWVNGPAQLIYYIPLQWQ